MTTREQEQRIALLGPGYDPHGGFAALRREAAFYQWLADGKRAEDFAASVQEVTS